MISINKIRSSILIILLFVFIFGCSQAKTDKKKSKPIVEATPIVDDSLKKNEWETFLKEISELSGESLIEKLCEGYDKFTEPYQKKILNKKYDEGAVSIFVDNLCNDEVVNKISEPKCIGVFSLVGKGGSVSEEGEEWAEIISSKIVQKNKYKVLERSQIKKITEEKHLQGLEDFDDSTRKEIGKMLGASAIVLGKMGKNIYVRLVDVETGEVYASSYVQRCDYTGDSLTDVEIIQKNDNPLGLKVWTERSNYKLGDSVKFFCTAKEDCYVTLIAIQHDGAVDQLFPNDYSGNGFIKGGEILQIPPENSGFEIEASPPAGKQKVKAIASKTIKGLEYFPKRREVKDPEITYQRTRDLKVKVSKEPPSSWSEYSFVFTINE